METGYGFLALVPPVVAISLCFATKQVLISMFAGLFAGSLIMSPGTHSQPARLPLTKLR